MAIEDQLKKEFFLGSEAEPEVATVDDTIFVREQDGTWRYAENWLKVPGARDLTLTERFQPKFVVAGTGSGAEVERVVVSGADVQAHPDLLDWCLQAGAPVRGPGDELLEVLVPYELWQEQDRIPNEIVAPELHGNKAEQELAIAQRKYQEAEQALEEAAAVRTSVLQQNSGKLTREKAREITGLSVGRVQQLVKSEVELDTVDRHLLLAIGNLRPKSENEIAENLMNLFGFGMPRGMLKNGVFRLRQLNLIDRTRSGYRLTSEGQEEVAAIQAAEKIGGPQVA